MNMEEKRITLLHYKKKYLIITHLVHSGLGFFFFGCCCCCWNISTILRLLELEMLMVLYSHWTPILKRSTMQSTNSFSSRILCPIISYYQPAITLQTQSIHQQGSVQSNRKRLFEYIFSISNLIFSAVIIFNKIIIQRS